MKKSINYNNSQEIKVKGVFCSLIKPERCFWNIKFIRRYWKSHARRLGVGINYNQKKNSKMAEFRPANSKPTENNAESRTNLISNIFRRRPFSFTSTIWNACRWRSESRAWVSNLIQNNLNFKRKLLSLWSFRLFGWYAFCGHYEQSFQQGSESGCVP